MPDQPHIVEVTDDNFDQTVIAASHKAPVLVDFWAEWCGPCKQLFPILAKLVEEYAGGFVIGKLNIDEQSGLAAEAGVRSVPMVLVFRKGMVTDQFLGLQPESAIRQIIDRNLFTEADRLMDRARDAYQRGDTAGVVSLVHEALAVAPGQHDIQLECAHFLLAAGELDEAEKMIRELPREIRNAPEADALLSQIQMARALTDAPPPEELAARLVDEPENTMARYQLAAHHLSRDEYEAALEHLLVIRQQDRGFGEDAGRRGMIAIFSMLDEESPLLHQYRTKMFNALH